MTGGSRSSGGKMGSSFLWYRAAHNIPFCASKNPAHIKPTLTELFDMLLRYLGGMDSRISWEDIAIEAFTCPSRTMSEKS